MKEQLEGFGFTGIEFQMKDEHATYFDAMCRSTDTIVELKVTHDSNFASFREFTREDWQDLDFLEMGETNEN